jgi:hypothetical protein
MCGCMLTCHRLCPLLAGQLKYGVGCEWGYT